MQRLVQEGFRVYAGMRKAQDGGVFAVSQVVPVVFDVTRDETGSDGLSGLVTNAGIGEAGPIEYVRPQM